MDLASLRFDIKQLILRPLAGEVFDAGSAVTADPSVGGEQARPLAAFGLLPSACLWIAHGFSMLSAIDEASHLCLFRLVQRFRESWPSTAEFYPMQHVNPPLLQLVAELAQQPHHPAYR